MVPPIFDATGIRQTKIMPYPRLQRCAGKAWKSVSTDFKRRLCSTPGLFDVYIIVNSTGNSSISARQLNRRIIQADAVTAHRVNILVGRIQQRQAVTQTPDQRIQGLI